MNVQARDTSSHMLTNEDGYPVMQQVKIITDAEEHENTIKKWRIELRMKGTEKQNLISYKQLLLGLILGQVDHTVKQQMPSLLEFKKIKKY